MANSNDYMRGYMANRRTTRRQVLLNMRGNKCEICESTEKLEFDHINSNDRSFLLSGCGLDKPWNRILEELAKCKLLCKLCHDDKTITYDIPKTSWNKGLSKNGLLVVFHHGTAKMYTEKRCRCLHCSYAKLLYRTKSIDYDTKTTAPIDYKPRKGRPPKHSDVAQLGRAVDC